MAKYEDILDEVMAAVRPFTKAGVELEPDTELVAGAGVDSVSMMNILLDLERRLAIPLSAADITFDSFRTCASLAEHFAKRKA